MKILRQVWQMIRHDKLFSGIYIFGTALAVASGTALAVLNWMQIAPVYPEYQRDNTYYVKSVYEESDGSTRMFRLSYPLVRDFFLRMPLSCRPNTRSGATTGPATSRTVWPKR